MFKADDMVTVTDLNEVDNRMVTPQDMGVVQEVEGDRILVSFDLPSGTASGEFKAAELKEW